MDEMLQPLMKIAEMELGGQKYCSHCGEYWPADKEFFNLYKNNPDGLDIYCKDCRKQLRQAKERKTKISFSKRRDAARRHRVQTKKRLANTIITSGEL